MAPPDGLEPPNGGIKIRCLTNLAKRVYVWSGRRGSNSRHLPWQGNALPAELLPHKTIYYSYKTALANLNEDL